MGNRFNVEYYSLLASRIRRHDSDAFTELYHTTYQDLYRYAYYFLRMHILRRTHSTRFIY